MKPPTATKTRSHGSSAIAPPIPIPIAPVTETAASATSVRSPMPVPSGRPFSSSSAWAPIPTARKNAARAGPSSSRAAAPDHDAAPEGEAAHPYVLHSRVTPEGEEALGRMLGREAADARAEEASDLPPRA